MKKKSLLVVDDDGIKLLDPVDWRKGLLKTVVRKKEKSIFVSAEEKDRIREDL